MGNPLEGWKLAVHRKLAEWASKCKL